MVRIKQRYLLLNVLYPENTRMKSSPNTPSYLKFHGPAPAHINSHVFMNLLKTEITHLFGDHGIGLSLSSLKVVYYSQATSTAILRVPRTYFQLAWAALTSLQELPAKNNSQQPATKCVVRVVRVSGTIKKAEQELLRRSRRDIVRAKLASGDNSSSVLNTMLQDDNTGELMPDPTDEVDIMDFDEEESESE